MAPKTLENGGSEIFDDGAHICICIDVEVENDVDCDADENESTRETGRPMGVDAKSRASNECCAPGRSVVERVSCLRGYGW